MRERERETLGKVSLSFPSRLQQDSRQMVKNLCAEPGKRVVSS